MRALTVKRKVHFAEGCKGRKSIENGDAPPPSPAAAPEPTRVPRISQLMALAIHFDWLIREGNVKDQAELARLGGVSRARLTQIMNLTLLAPEIQEKLLFSEGATVSDASIRQAASEPLWHCQRHRLT